MYSKQLLALAASVSYASAAIYQGFNYGAEADFATEFALAKNLAGTNGKFASARLYTTISPGTANTPTGAIQAAIDNGVTLLLGLWGSGGQGTIDNEIAALKNAISQYGSKFTSLVAGISVGSEDLYRISPTGVINKSGIGANPEEIVSYIGQVRKAIAGTALSSAPVGHVDTWTAWVNGSNSAVAAACDFVGVDAYPYFQNTQANAIENAYDLFFSAYDQTVAAAQGKPVWVTETGWPASGKTEGQAVPSTDNAEIYWKQVACKLLGNTNTWWYTLNDNGANPSFGVTTGSSTPLYDLSCKASVASSSSVAVSKTSTSAASETSSSAAAGTSSVAAGSSSSAVVSSSASASDATTSANTATPTNSIVPVSSSAVPTQGGGSPRQSSGIQSVSTGTSTTLVIIPSATGGSNATISSPAVPSPTGNSASSVRLAAGGLVAVLIAMIAAL